MYDAIESYLTLPQYLPDTIQKDKGRCKICDRGRSPRLYRIKTSEYHADGMIVVGWTRSCQVGRIKGRSANFVK